MGFDLRNASGETLHVSGGHWAVFLSLAEAYGWKPAGTVAPTTLAAGTRWHGRYDSSDGQLVTEADAKQLAAVLHAAAVHPQIALQVTETIARIEHSVEAEGLRIPDEMRMRFEHFRDEFSPLLMFLYQGAFTIDGKAPAPAGGPPGAPWPSGASAPGPAPAPSGTPIAPTSLLPFLHNARWAGWDGVAHRSLEGGVETAATPLYGIATVVGGEGGVPRLLSRGDLVGLGDPKATESLALANLDRLPHAPFEVVEFTKGMLGFGKKPLSVVCRGPFAAERVLSRAFLDEARAAIGHPLSIAVAIPDKQTVIVRNHDAPHFGSAFEVLSEFVKKSFGGGAAEALCNGIAVIGSGDLWGARYVRAPMALASYDRVTYTTREVADVPTKLLLSRDEELESAPEFAPPADEPLRLRGRHRDARFLEFELLTRSPREVNETTRAFLARLAGSVPGTLVAPLTHVRVVLKDATSEGDYERILRHPNVVLCTPTGKKRELRLVSGPSARMVDDNLSRPLSALAADGYA